jgi:para-aminobenzoate synthetase component 1
MLNWLRRFNIFCLLESHQYADAYGRFGMLAGVGVRAATVPGADVKTLDAFVRERRWAFGHLSFNLQHVFFPDLEPYGEDKIGFPDFYFFEPEIVLDWRRDELIIEAIDPELVFLQLQLSQPESGNLPGQPVTMKSRLTRDAYLWSLKKLLEHIHRGDCYEINFCQEYFATPPEFDPWPVYKKLSELSPTPFGGFYRLNDQYLLSASPERYLQKRGDKIIAQPIKGTARRVASPEADMILRNNLLLSPKERAENVMVVDLMRNDLSRICTDGSVVVPELFGLYTFPQVHQMISTVTGQLRTGVGFSELLEATFPMGSMTGAPKQRVLELIRKYEPVQRGLFSGSVGYCHEGDFDFNVVIRSLQYNAKAPYLTYSVGSGITAYCNPEEEWEECRLKAMALEKALGNVEY